MAELKNDDLLLVNRADEAYKAPGEAIYASYLVKPVIENVNLVESNPGVEPRFTNQEFVTTVTMAEEGQPLSEKTIDAFVEGAILRQTETSEITNISDDILNEPWTLQALSGESTYNALDVCWWPEKNLYLMVGYAASGTTPMYKYSSNGLDFNTAGSITVSSFVGIGTGGIVAGTTTAVATSQANNTVKLRYSTTGTSWTDVNATAGNKLVAGDSNAPTNVNDIATDGINFVAVGITLNYAAQTAYNEVWTSTNGIDWTNPIDPLSIGNIYNNRATTYAHIAYGNGVWVAGGIGGVNSSNPADNRKFIYSTNNGSSWSFGTSPFDGNKDPECADVCYSQSLNRFVATFSGGNEILWSDDGITWNAAEFTSITDEDGTPATFGCRAVTYGNGKFIAVFGTSNYKSLNNTTIQLPKVYQSTDGKNWEAVPGLDTETAWQNATCGNPDSKRFVAVRSANLQNIRSIMYSDGGAGTYSYKDLTFQNNQDFEFIDVGSTIKSSGGATGEVLEITSESNFMKINPFSGNLSVGETVLGPVIITDNAKKYLDFDSSGNVLSLLNTPQSPAYVTTDENPVLTLKFPATFPSGFTPDEELGEGTTLTVEATATNVVGSDGPKSDTVQPSFTVIPDPVTQPNLAGLVTLWTGNNGSSSDISRSIVNGINNQDDGGFVWIKARTNDAWHWLYDTQRGPNSVMFSNQAGDEQPSPELTSFDTNGFTLNDINANRVGENYVGWNLNKAPGYFDFVERSFPSGSSGSLAIPHSLGTKPGCIIGKAVNGPGNWHVYHSSLGINKVMYLDSDGTAYDVPGEWGASEPTDTEFFVDAGMWTNTETIFYLFAEDTPNVIKCGNATGSGRQLTGFKTQFVLIKSINETGKWIIMDDKRTDRLLYPDSSEAEESGGTWALNDDGFTISSAYSASTEWIYVAIAAPPLARSLTAEELEAQKLKFLTYSNRKEVVCGEQATAARATLQATLLEAGYDAVDIAQAYSNLDN